MMGAADWQALLLTLRLAAVVTLLLLVISTPLAWWLATTRSRMKAPVAALVAMPLVLPPTVIGFYLLIAMGPAGFIGQATEALGLGLLPFTFWGLVVGSLVYSLPFVVQPLQNAMQAIGSRPLEVAASMGAGPYDRFFSVVLPQAKSGYISAAVLGFAHTLGEFGVVLMIGGNLAGETRVASIQIYDHVESLQYADAHALSAVMVVLSFVLLIALYSARGLSRTSNGVAQANRAPSND
ncbi:Molybdenum transport system permease protein ModB [BD1-7 clade bacterium]|uniref:Molybdenum transport system permease n=1 Tax=BD1-7 clade bacterium TaxID=2029982 RepID=A0A5S9N212_9GAMM|nr:Molybdenum transport system permease protein ModB [BD1-7 clade bacterium]CAA0083693.1 Molybdenum transport system permease protein ModB [BD1-7 clade bacterium]